MEQRSSYRYIICACSAGLMLINMGLLSTAFSSYFPYMRELRQFSNTQLYLLPTIRNISTIVFTLFSEAYYRKIGLKKGCLIALMCTALGFIMLAVAPGFWLYQLSMILFGFSYAVGATIPASLLIRQWFPGNTAGAMGVVTAGSGIAFIFLPMYIRHFVYKIGLEQTLGIEAVAIVILSAIIFLFIKEAEPQSSAPQKGAVKAVVRNERQELNRGQSLRLYIAFFGLGCLALTGVSGLSMLYSTTGHSTETAGDMISAFGIALIVGKLLFGWLCSRIGNLRATFVYTALLVIGTALCCMSQDAPYLLLLCSSVIFSLGCCLASVGLTVIATDMSSTASFGKMLKNLQFIYTVGGFVTGTLPGILADITGSYVPAYQCFLVISLLFAGLLIPLYRNRVKNL